MRIYAPLSDGMTGASALPFTYQIQVDPKDALAARFESCFASEVSVISLNFIS